MVESLCIPEDYYFEDDFVNYSNIFKRMQSLKTLIVRDGPFSSNFTITYLPSSLRLIDWPGYPSFSLPDSFEPSQLVVLCLRESWLVQLCPISKKFSNLKHLDLRDSCELTKTPNFGDIPNLKKLHLEGCVNLEEVHPSLGHCRMLTYLSLYGCHKLKKLPKFVCTESLETLNLLECTSLEEFPEICGVMRRLSILNLGSPWIRSLLPSFSGVRDLQLAYCEILESIPDAIRNLCDLRISGCNKLETLPNSLFESQQLEHLEIHRCSGLVKLPISLGVQKNLCWLEIDRCENLKKLPSSIQMESLLYLSISNSPKLDTFAEIKGDMHCLKELALNSTGIREMPSSISNLSGLAELNLTGCEDLVSLPGSLCNLMNLRRLFLSGCKRLEKLPENIGDLHQVASLEFCQNLNGPPNLKGLFADYHLALKSIRDLVINCLKLYWLVISNCGAVSSEQVNVFLQHFLKTCIQCDFHQRDYFVIFFPDQDRIPELFNYDRFINQKVVSIDLKPSWYTNKFMGFWLCYGPTGLGTILSATLICKSDPERKYSLRYNNIIHRNLRFIYPFICCVYIPFETLWNGEGNKEGKNPNDYYMLEVNDLYRKWEELCFWGIRLVYEKDAMSDDLF